MYVLLFSVQSPANSPISATHVENSPPSLPQIRTKRIAAQRSAAPGQQNSVSPVSAAPTTPAVDSEGASANITQISSAKPSRFVPLVTDYSSDECPDYLQKLIAESKTILQESFRATMVRESGGLLQNSFSSACDTRRSLSPQKAVQACPLFDFSPSPSVASVKMVP